MRLAAGGRHVVRMRLTRAARAALRGRRLVPAVLSVELRPAAGGEPVRDRIRLRVALSRPRRR